MNVWKIEPEHTEELPPIVVGNVDGGKITKRVFVHNTKKMGQHLVVQDTVKEYHIFLMTGGLMDEVSPLEERREYASDPV